MVRGSDANRPDPVQAAWLYAQMARWRQAPLSDDMRVAAQAVFRSDLYDAAIGAAPCASQPIDGVGAFVGPLFNADDVADYVSRWRGKNERPVPMRVVR
jgi:NitT/TauT family transport system ATP-binding protein